MKFQHLNLLVPIAAVGIVGILAYGADYGSVKCGAPLDKRVEYQATYEAADQEGTLYEYSFMDSYRLGDPFLESINSEFLEFVIRKNGTVLYSQKERDHVMSGIIALPSQYTDWNAIKTEFESKWQQEHERSYYFFFTPAEIASFRQVMGKTADLKEWNFCDNRTYIATLRHPASESDIKKIDPTIKIYTGNNGSAETRRIILFGTRAQMEQLFQHEFVESITPFQPYLKSLWAEEGTNDPILGARKVSISFFSEVDRDTVKRKIQDLGGIVQEDGNRITLSFRDPIDRELFIKIITIDEVESIQEVDSAPEQLPLYE